MLLNDVIPISLLDEVYRYNFGILPRDIISPTKKIVLDKSIYPSFRRDHSLIADIFDVIIKQLGPRALRRCYLKIRDEQADFETAILNLNDELDLVFELIPLEAVDIDLIFLREMCKTNPHYNGVTEFEHLINTYTILDSMDCTVETAIAGLWHNAYFIHFKGQEVHDRTRVVGLIGSEAEAMIYKFSRYRYENDAFNSLLNDNDISMKYILYANYVDLDSRRPPEEHKYSEQIVSLKARINELQI